MSEFSYVDSLIFSMRPFVSSFLFVLFFFLNFFAVLILVWDADDSTMGNYDHPWFQLHCALYLLRLLSSQLLIFLSLWIDNLLDSVFILRRLDFTDFEFLSLWFFCFWICFGIMMTTFRLVSFVVMVITTLPTILIYHHP